MKRYAVSHINWHDHELKTVIVEAEGWREAAVQHEAIAVNFALTREAAGDEKNVLPEDQDAAKELAFDCDCMIEVVEIV